MININVRERQSEHDGAVNAAADIYRSKGKCVWINPDGQRSREWAGRYIDVIAADSPGSTSAWVTEVETEDSVSESEASSQWEDYANVYDHWHLAVPKGSEESARNLLQKHGISNCTVITWQKNSKGTHTFWGLPGI